MKKSFEYRIKILGHSKDQILIELSDKIKKLDEKFGKDIGAEKERKKIISSINELKEIK